MAYRRDFSLLKRGLNRWNEWREKNPEIVPDLSGIERSKEDLSGFNLSLADLSGANLSSADLSGANLSSANLSRADLRRVNLSAANLKGADLSEADLSGADLSGAILIEIDVNGANFSGANLAEINLSGTNFSGVNLNRVNLRGADLRRTDFMEANLSGANLSGANLRKANFIKAKLDGADLNGTDFSEANLSRAVLKEADLREAILKRAILKGAILSTANLSVADLEEANLEEANLKRVNLRKVNLSRTQALATDFTAADFTGACLENWNINSATKLDDIDCQYVYLRSDNQERRPSSGEFAPGEFTKLFQKALETVDLIFVDGIDWKAFFLSFEELRAEYGEDNLAVQAIEKKSGGAFVIRLEVPPEANKADIESQAKELYEIKLNALEARYRAELQAKNEQIAIYHQHNASLQHIIYTLASRPIQNIIDITAQAWSESMSEAYKSKYDLRNAQVGGFVDTAQAGSRQDFNQHNYAPEQRQNLAEAAAEIQLLLNQLAQTNPTTTEVVTEAIHQEIKRNPTLKARLQAALKAGGLEALKAIFNHPLFSIPAETIKGWLEAE